MVKYTFLVKIDDTTITSIVEAGLSFKECFDALDFRLTIRCDFKNYEILSTQKI